MENVMYIELNFPVQHSGALFKLGSYGGARTRPIQAVLVRVGMRDTMSISLLRNIHSYVGARTSTTKLLGLI